jgi:hypothetical protein
MNQNQPVDDDLQKAIDNITNTTNTDPVFSDPVAAPSSIPEGDTGELAEPVGPFPEPQVEMPLPAPEPLAPVESVVPAPEPIAPAPVAPEPIAPAAPTFSRPTLEPVMEKDFEPIPPQALSTGQVKKAALRDLVPLLDHINMDALQKFNIYRDIFEDLKDYTILEPAYRAAREIPDEVTRAEALLYLVESIDKM